MNMSVSVIIPVYNAASFVSEAVESALAQPETAEIVLVEDGSPDNSWEVCKALTEKYEKVHLYRHPGGVNRGACASRNLGMEKSTCGYIAFLDADDFYLPGRFQVAARIFEANPDCDGVYEAIGIYFNDKAGKQRWLSSNMSRVQITTITKYISSEDLFRTLAKGGAGHIHLNGLVIKRNVLRNSGYINEKLLSMHEDTDFVVRLAAVGKLLPGRLDEPVAMRRVHGENRISAPRSSSSVFRDRMKMWMATYDWCKKQVHKEKRQLIFKRMMGDYIREKPGIIGMMRLPPAIQDRVKLLLWLFEYPKAVLEEAYWKEMIPVFIWNAFKSTKV
jgi:glycosyltransferase involved in cell wall biosynthesis